MAMKRSGMWGIPKQPRPHAMVALMIQARHLFYGLAMLVRYKGYGVLCAAGAAGVRITETGGAVGASPVCFNDRMYQN